MSSTPSKVPSISSSTPNASKKHSSSSTPGRSEKASNHSSSDSAKKDKKHTSSKSEKEPKRVEEMDADELVDHINGDNDSSISSLDVSEDEAPKAEEKSKKRKREEEASIQYDDEPLTETLLMKKTVVKKAAVDVSEIQGDDVQLWLFKLPETLDVETLNGMSMNIGSAMSIEDVEYTLSEGATLEYDSLVNIWPDTETGKMSLGKPFSKIIHIAEAPKASSTDATKIVANLAAFLKFGTTRSPLAAMHYDDTATPELKVRYAPGGASIPVSTSKPSFASVPSPVKSNDFSSHSKEEKHKHKEHKHKHKEHKHKHKE